MVTDIRLRERNFGNLELGSDRHYANVWDQDRVDAHSRYQGSESANQVMDRITSLVVECEQEFAGQDFLLVSHGDALQILQAAFAD